MPATTPDEFDRELVANTAPPNWRNPTPTGRYNLVVLGAGTAGLVSAAGAAGLGAKVALVEHHLLGGDRSEERRVGKECRCRCAAEHKKKHSIGGQHLG